MSACNQIIPTSKFNFLPEDVLSCSKHVEDILGIKILVSQGALFWFILCMYKVTIRCVLATIVAVEKQQVLHIVSVCVCVYV